MRILLDQLRSQWRELAGVFILATIHQLLLLAEPHVIRLIIDRWVMHAETMPWGVFFRGVLWLVGIGMLVALGARIARIFQEYGAGLIAQRVSIRMYSGSVAHSLLLPFDIFEDQRSGELLHKIQKARVDAQIGITHLVRLYLAALAIVAVTIYAFTVSYILGFFFACLIPFLGVSVFLLSRPIRRQQVVIAQEGASIAGSATETFRNVELARSLGVHGHLIARLDAANERLLSLEQRKLRLVRLFAFAEGTIMNTGRAALILVMLWLVHSRGITIGEFLTFFLYAQWLFTPLSELSATVSRYQEARASFDALDEIMNIAPVKQENDSELLGALSEIRFDDVILKYDRNARTALDGVNLSIRAGETVALVGPSGSGKSSIVKLLTGLYRPTAGTVRINNIDIQKIDISDLRGRIGVVTQETHLFSGTVRDNLTLVLPDASEERCLRALSRAGGADISQGEGSALDTRIGESGQKLSGGERQRIAIARALLRDPELLIFDEATSNLDPISERAINATISEIVRSGTRITLIVAHRLSAIAHADRIIVLAGGRVVESGTHDSLLAARGLYSQMYEQQSHSTQRM